MGEVITDPASWMLAIPIWSLAAWIGWNIDHWKANGFDIEIRTDIRYRFVWLFLSVTGIK